MWTQQRRTSGRILVLLAAVLFGMAAVFSTAADNPRQAESKPKPDANDANPAEILRLPTLEQSKNVSRQLEAAEDYIAESDWVTATKILQDLLERREDFLVPAVVMQGQQKTGVRLSTRMKIEQLLAGLPRPGRDFYELRYGPTAAELLKTAREEKDTALLQRLISLYLYTPSGPPALADLAAHYYAVKNYGLAARSYELLLRHSGVARWTPEQLFQAAVAFHLAADADNAGLVRRELLSRGTVQIGDRRLTSEQLRQEFDKLPKPGQVAEWRMFGGDATRNAQGSGTAPFLVMEWHHPTTRTAETKAYLDQAETLLRNRELAVLPGMVPLVTTTLNRDSKPVPLVLFRSHWGLHAANMQNGKMYWETPAQFSFDRMMRDARLTKFAKQWVAEYLNDAPQWLFENTLIGTLSCDDERVYIVDDFPLLPKVSQIGDAPLRLGTPQLDAALQANRIEAYTLKDGKLKWDLGRTGPAELGDGYFLGPPLPLDGKLYVAYETEVEPPKPPKALLVVTPELLAAPRAPAPKASAPPLRARGESTFQPGIWSPGTGHISLKPRDARGEPEPTPDTREVRLVTLDPTSGRVLAARSLFTHAQDRPISLRMQAVQLTAGNGVLLCCAHTGTIVAYDLLTEHLLWSRNYDETPAPGPAKAAKPLVQGPGRPYWKATAPIIAEGKVVVAACDSNQLLCLNLRNGSLVWSVNREPDDLYLAGVVHGKALVVGKGSARAISLTTGKQLWQVATGMPSGYGTLCEDRYYLPLKEATGKKQPGIAVLDLEKGVVTSYIPARKDEVPGNLVFAEDHVLSQSAFQLTAYPQSAARLKVIDAALAKNPNDPEGLYARAVLRMANHNVWDAVEDLRKALENKPSDDTRPLIRAKLYEALTEAFQSDFGMAKKYVAEYADVCDVAVANDPNGKLTPEQRQRCANYFLVVGRGREKEGELREATRLYLNLAAVMPGPGRLFPMPDDPDLKVNVEVWVHNRLEEMLKIATPKQRQEIEEELLERWKKTGQGNKEMAERLQALLASQRGEAKPAKEEPPAQWLLFGGNPARNAQGNGGVPFLESLWKTRLIRTADTERFIDQAAKDVQEHGQPLLPAAMPITAMIRGLEGFHAVLKCLH